MRGGGGSGLRLAALAAAGLAGCAAPPPDDGPAEAACLTAVAAHVGGSPEMRIARTGDGPDGGAVHEVRDGAPGRDRVHFCETDAAGRVTALLHPGA
jgi:hypothetical protein